MLNIMNLSNAYIDGLLARLRNTLTVSLFATVESFFLQLAAVAAPVAAVLGALIAVVVAIKVDSLALFLGGAGWALAVVIMYYVGSKLLKSCANTIASNPSNIGSQEYLDVIAFLNLVGMVAVLVVSAYGAIKFGRMEALWVGIGVALVLFYVVWIMLHPRLISIFVKPAASAGIDAIAILVLVNKIYLRAAKIFFGLATTVGAILLLFSLFKSFGDGQQLLMSGLSGLAGFIAVGAGLLAPLFCYLVFIFSYLMLDVLRSILSLQTAQADPVSLEVTEPEAPVEQPVDSISPQALKKAAIVLAVAVGGIALVIQGKVFYAEYQVKAEQRRIEEARLKEEEERKKAAEAAEQERLNAERARISTFVDAARKHLKGTALDLLLEPEINKAYREIFRNSMSVFESYFTQPEAVTEAEGYITAAGCRKEDCGNFRAFLAIEVSTGKVSTVAYSNGQIKYFGVSEDAAPAVMKKWVLGQQR